MLDAKILLEEVIPYLSEGKVGKQREIDLEELEKAGITHPDVAKVRKLLAP